MEQIFCSYCEQGELVKAQKIYKEYVNINIHADDEYAFRWSCSKGHLEVGK